MENYENCICSPKLPPKEGYVEIIVEGVPQYKRINGYKSREELEQENSLLQTKLDTINKQQDFLEDCLAEAIILLYNK